MITQEVTPTAAVRPLLFLADYRRAGRPVQITLGKQRSAS